VRTIIAGSRDCTDYAHVAAAMKGCGWVPTLVLSGCAKGADKLGEEWAKNNGVPVELHPADWTKYGKSAGIHRNLHMAANADALVALWDGESHGTSHMIQAAQGIGLRVFVYRYSDPEPVQCRVVHCKKAPHDIYIGRPGKWGNPFELGKDGTREEVVQKYADWIINQPELLDSLHELVGKTLGCWCAPHACHGDILAKLANAYAAQQEEDEVMYEVRERARMDALDVQEELKEQGDIQLRLKPEPPDYPLGPEAQADLDKLRLILKIRGYEASDNTIRVAWEKYSDDSLCMSWLGLDAVGSDDKVFEKIMEYLEPHA